MEVLAPDRIRPLQRAEYDRLVASGCFADERLELLRGALVTMSPQGAGHAECVRRLTELLVLALVGRAAISPQCPFAATSDSEPEPDLAVLPLASYHREHPTAAHLVIEVAASSLGKDRAVKAGIYAESGVPEYWIVDLAAERIEVRRAPTGGDYRELTTVRRGERIGLVAFPEVALEVDAILPPAEPSPAGPARASE